MQRRRPPEEGDAACAFRRAVGEAGILPSHSSEKVASRTRSAGMTPSWQQMALKESSRKLVSPCSMRRYCLVVRPIAAATVPGWRPLASRRRRMVWPTSFRFRSRSWSDIVSRFLSFRRLSRLGRPLCFLWELGRFGQHLVRVEVQDLADLPNPPPREAGIAALDAAVVAGGDADRGANLPAS